MTGYRLVTLAWPWLSAEEHLHGQWDLAVPENKLNFSRRANNYKNVLLTGIPRVPEATERGENKVPVGGEPGMLQPGSSTCQTMAKIKRSFIFLVHIFRQCCVLLGIAFIYYLLKI